MTFHEAVAELADVEVGERAQMAFVHHVQARALVQRALRNRQEAEAAWQEAETGANVARIDLDFWVSALIERGLY